VEASQDVSYATTGLAILAFLGAGYDEKTPSPYRRNVQAAVNWLVSKQKPNGGLMGGDAGYDATTYTQAICTLALAEAYGMAKNPKVGEVAQKGVDCLLDRQKPYSGWRYGHRSTRTAR